MSDRKEFITRSGESPKTGTAPSEAVGNGAPLLSIVIPVRNDAPSVNIMTRILNALIDVPCELIIVYDDPSDDAVPVIEQLSVNHRNLRGVLNRASPGMLPAVRAGVDTARGSYVLIYAADEIGPALAIPHMLELMEAGCDLVSATRYRAGGRRYGGSRLGHLLSSTANGLFRLCSCTALSDCTTGIKMFRRELFRDLDLRGDGRGWSFAFEMAINAQLLGASLGEVPIVSIDRLFGGRSTFKPIPWMISYFRWFAVGIAKLPPWRRPRPRLTFPVVPRT